MKILGGLLSAFVVVVVVGYLLPALQGVLSYLTGSIFTIAVLFGIAYGAIWFLSNLIGGFGGSQPTIRDEENWRTNPPPVRPAPNMAAGNPYKTKPVYVKDRRALRGTIEGKSTANDYSGVKTSYGGNYKDLLN